MQSLFQPDTSTLSCSSNQLGAVSSLKAQGHDGFCSDVLQRSLIQHRDSGNPDPLLFYLLRAGSCPNNCTAENQAHRSPRASGSHLLGTAHSVAGVCGDMGAHPWAACSLASPTRPTLSFPLGITTLSSWDLRAVRWALLRGGLGKHCSASPRS